MRFPAFFTVCVIANIGKKRDILIATNLTVAEMRGYLVSGWVVIGTVMYFLFVLLSI